MFDQHLLDGRLAEGAEFVEDFLGGHGRLRGNRPGEGDFILREPELSEQEILERQGQNGGMGNR
jgi:hypothetical protein